MKIVAVALVVCLLAMQLAQADNAVEHLKTKVQSSGDTVQATKMVANGGAACGSDPCADDGSNGPSVNEALEPVDDWLKAFKKRVGAGNADLYEAAKSTVQPLLKKLKDTQDAAIEKLKASNEAIRNHVEQAATEHVYNLLKAGQRKATEEEEVEKSKAEKEEAEENAKEAEEEKKDAEERAKSTEKAVEEEEKEAKADTEEKKKIKKAGKF